MNPISHARYLTNISTTALSKKLGVSRQYISRLEQGLYDKPSDELLKWTVEILNRNIEKPVTKEVVNQLYKEWQWQKRESVKLDKSLLPCSVTKFDRVRQPDVVYYHKVFVQWRNDYWNTSHAFCVDMCLHPSPVVDYEEGITYKMPSALKQVMSELNLLGEGFKTSER
ncbi:helix-turn-helix transcriptional regulator [Streptomyces hebeiensis]